MNQWAYCLWNLWGYFFLLHHSHLLKRKNDAIATIFSPVYFVVRWTSYLKFLLFFFNISRYITVKMIFLELFNYKRKKKTEQKRKKQNKKLLAELQKRHYLRYSRCINYNDTSLTFLVLTLKTLTLFTSQYQHFMQWYHKLHSLFF